MHDVVKSVTFDIDFTWEMRYLVLYNCVTFLFKN